VTLACAREAPRNVPHSQHEGPPGPAGPAARRTEHAGPHAAPESPKGPEAGAERLAERHRASAALAVFSGEASYYSDKLAGRKTASGAPYDPRAFTAAHKTLPFGTVVRVLRANPPGHVYVTINDRGPFVRGRVLDLSRAAAESLQMMRAGVIPVRAEIVEYGPKPAARRRGRRR
jgi:rare lipoprotein A